jgi:hypothetical protein
MNNNVLNNLVMGPLVFDLRLMVCSLRKVHRNGFLMVFRGAVRLSKQHVCKMTHARI